MYIAVFKNNGKDYLRLMESYRTKNAEGKVAIRKRIIYNIGPFSKFDDGRPDYLERLRESFRLGSPLIPELEKYTSKKSTFEKYAFRLQEGDPECRGFTGAGGISAAGVTATGSAVKETLNTAVVIF